MEMKELSSILQENGIAGAGGAGFPTYAKLDERAQIILLNCAECEPLLKLHRQLLERNAREIVKTFSQIAKTVGAGEAIIGIKKAYHGAIEALQACIEDYPLVKLGLLDEVYPAGDEVVLIYELTKKVVKPGGLPIESGIAVFNVETVYNVYRALNGEHPVTEKLVSVVGEVNAPVTVIAPIGCTLGEVVAAAGGSAIENPVYFVGGPMMGFIGNPYMPVTKTTNAILVLPQTHLLVQKKRRNSSIDLKRAAACCCNCSMCTDLCPRHLLGHPIEPHRFMQAAICKDVQQPDIFLNTMYCSSCGLCENYACMQGLSPRSLISDYKAGLRANGIKPTATDARDMDAKQRSLRRVPMERLMARLQLSAYDKPAPIQESLLQTKQVKILLSQHIGAPAVPIVQPGDSVIKEQMIGKPGNGLSIAVHASIEGRVEEVTSQYVTITGRS